MGASLLKKVFIIGLIVFTGGVVASFAMGYSVFGVGSASVQSSANVELDGAEMVDVDLDMSVGELILQGGTDFLMEGTFVSQTDPAVDYNVKGNRGYLNVKEKGSRTFFTMNFDFFSSKNNRNDWNITLNESIPINLRVQTGVGTSEINLEGLQLTDLNIDTGVGETIVDLSGDWVESFDSNISTGVGETVIILPTDVGVRLEINQGLGSISVDGLTKDGIYYVNDAYDGGDVVLTIFIDSGVGDVKVQ
ncbi:toast rack family protein [Evansella tamaricis]|uniref:Adhesin domain-containing protein n=1 Tax=Evansella tamaricis TaxID=2069301 RepID=A0ABS6JHH6_9BACI|nr:toast rack family protein [Evansella tamaricis]MBU9713125.1 hypothetical protein [Evansella tamaricis]